MNCRLSSHKITVSRWCRPRQQGRLGSRGARARLYPWSVLRTTSWTSVCACGRACGVYPATALVLRASGCWSRLWIGWAAWGAPRAPATGDSALAPPLSACACPDLACGGTFSSPPTTAEKNTGVQKYTLYNMFIIKIFYRSLIGNGNLWHKAPLSGMNVFSKNYINITLLSIRL